jgi:hypothetical protein
MDRAGSAQLPFAAGAMLQTVSVNARENMLLERAVGGLVKMQAGLERVGLQDEVSSLYSRMRRKPARNAFTGAGRIIHHLPWQYPSLCFLKPIHRLLLLITKQPICPRSGMVSTYDTIG